MKLLAALLITLSGGGGFAQDWGTKLGPGALKDRIAYLADQKLTDASGWPMRKPQEQWANAKTLVRNDPAWGHWLAERRQVLDAWMAQRQDHVDWIVGWAHDYVRPDGSALPWRVDDPPALDERNPASRKLREAWNFTFRGQHVDRVLEAARMYRLTGERSYADWAKGQLNFYAANYDKWPVQKRLGVSRLMGQSLDEAVLVLSLVDAARLLRDSVTPEQQREWGDRLFRPVAQTLDQSYNGLNNISCWQRSAMAVLALWLHDDDLFARATEGANGLRNLLKVGVTDDGLWYEGSLGYNSYVVRALVPFFEAVAMAGRGAAFAQEMVQVQNLMLVPMALRFPDDSLPNPSDSVGRLKVPDVGLLISARRVLPTRIGLQEAARRKSWEQLLDPAPPAPKEPVTLPQVTSQVLTSSHMAVLKSAAWQVYVHWGQNVSNHAQREALNLEVFAGAKPLTRDSGTALYGSPLHANYFTQPAAQNVPFSDDKGQLGWAPGELIKFDAAAGLISVSQPQYNANLAATRSLKLDGNRFTDELRLTPRAGQPPPASLGSTWQFDCKLEGLEALLPSFLPLPVGEGFQFWTDVRSYTGRDAIELRANCSGQRASLRLEIPGEFTLFKGTAPAIPPTSRDAIYLRVKGPSAIFKATFLLAQ